MCESFTSFSGSYYGHLKFCASFQIEQGGDYSSVWDIVLLGCVWLCSWLNESGRLCCCEFLYSSKKEEEEVVHWGGKKKIRYLLSAPLPGEKQWQLIPEGTSLSSACQHRQTTSFSTSFSHRGEKKKNQPSTNGSKPFPWRLWCSISVCASVTFIIQCLWKNGSSCCQMLRPSFISAFQSKAEMFSA